MKDRNMLLENTPTKKGNLFSPLSDSYTRTRPESQKRQSRVYRHYRHQKRPYSFLPAVVLGIALLIIWQIIVGTHSLPALLLPAPADVAFAFWQGLIDGSLLSSSFVTLVESLIGSLVGILVALPLGYALARHRVIAAAIQPYLAASQAMPAVALAPLIALWFGYGLASVVVLCALLVFFPLVITTTLGLRLLDWDILDAARVDGASGWTLLRSIEFPLALPAILAGIRTGVTLSITGAIVGEFVVGGQGLGELLLSNRNDVDTAGVFADLLVLAVLAIAFYGLARALEARYSYAEVA